MDGLFDAGDARAAESLAASSSQRSVFPSWNEAEEDAAQARRDDDPPSDGRRSRRRRSHSRGVSENLPGPHERPHFPQQSNEDEVEGYLPPMNGPSRKHRQRLDSVDSWGSSVMPAALPVRQAAGGYASHRSSKAAAARHQHEQQQAQQGAPSRSSGLEKWLNTTNRLTVPHLDRGAGGYQSFAPSGRVRRVDSDAASAAEGSIGAWSTGVRSTGGRRHRNKSSVGRDSSQARTRPPLWEAIGEGGQDAAQDEEKAEGSTLDSLLQWRQSSAIPPLPHDASQSKQSTPHRRKRASSSVRAGSVTESVLPASFSRQSLRKKDQANAPPLPPIYKPTTAELAHADAALLSRPSDTPLRTFVRGMMKEGLSARTIVILVLATSVISKWAIGAGGGWSGQTRVGWETARHWMSATLNLPIEEWYTFDVDHHVLTRPPMTAWWFLFQGKLASSLFPHLCPRLKFPPPLSTISTPSLSASMQTFLVISHIFTADLLYVIPTLLFLSRRLKDRGRRTKAIASATVLLQPVLVLVDYGLGDTRSIALGLCAGFLALFYTTLPNPDADSDDPAPGERDRKRRITTLSRQVSTSYVLARVLFTLGVLFDQSVLVFAPVVAALILGRLVGLASVRLSRGLTFFNWINGISIVSTAMPLLPWLLPLLSSESRSAATSSLSDMLTRLSGASGQLSGNKMPKVLLMPAVTGSPSSLLARLDDVLLNGRLSDHGSVAKVHWALTALLCFWPCLILLRAAKETVLIENFLHEGSASADAASKKANVGGPGGASPTLNTPRKSEAGASVARSHARSKTPGAASEAGSDLRSFAESMVRGGDSRGDIAGAAATAADGDDDEEDNKQRAARQQPRVSSSCPSPSAAVLPYVSCAVTLSIYLFSGVAFSSSTILFPLLPFTLLLVAKGDSWGGGSTSNDWEWCMLMNNACAFHLWPSIRSDGLPIQYVVTVGIWNWLVGHRLSDVGSVSRTAHYAMLLVHAVSLLDSIVSLPFISIDALVSVVSTTTFVVVWCWSVKRVAEVALGNGLALGFGKVKR